VAPVQHHDEWVRDLPEPGRDEAAAVTASVVVVVLFGAAFSVAVFFLLIYGW
jgi:hypothetical protein